MDGMVVMSLRGLIVGGGASVSVAALPAGMDSTLAPVVQTIVAETKAVSAVRIVEEFISLRRVAVARVAATLSTLPRLDSQQRKHDD